MGKTVLVAVDTRSISEATILYGIELASRIQASVTLAAVSPAKSFEAKDGLGSDNALPEKPKGKWMDHAVQESQRHAVTLEIFVAVGEFFEEIRRLTQARPTVGFIVLAAPKTWTGKDGAWFSSALNRLHKAFEGEILLVEKTGQTTRVGDLESVQRESTSPL